MCYLAFLRTGRTVVTTFVLHVVFPALLHCSLGSEGFPTLPGTAAATVSVAFKSLALNMIIMNMIMIMIKIMIMIMIMIMITSETC